MTEQPVSPTATSLIRHEPGVRVIRNINWAGMTALYLKEVRRFMKVQLQTVWAPALTTLLYLVIFVLAMGRGGIKVMGAPFADFIAPGLIIMGMIQNAYQNASFSLLVGKIQGTIVDFLMPPVSAGELLIALVASSITRAVMVGLAIWLVMLFWPGVHVMPAHLWAVLWFGFDGFGAAQLHRHPDVDLGREIRSCRGHRQFHRGAARSAVRHFLYRGSRRTVVPRGDARQSLLLCDFRLSLWLPVGGGFACPAGRDGICSR